MIADEKLDSPVAILGAGRLGRALAWALAAKGVAVNVHRGREAAASGLPPGAFEHARLLVVAVPDDAVLPLASRLASSLATGAGPRVALHLSGALDSSALAPLRALGCAVGSCHPLQTFPDPAVPPDAFAGVTFAVEGDPDARAAAEALARALGGKPITIDAELKPLYHLAAVLAGNGVVALVGAALDAMRAAGLSKRDALDALAPLARRSLEGALEKGPSAALTGPVARRDERTLEAHRRALDAWDPARRALYDALVAEQERLLFGKQKG